MLPLRKRSKEKVELPTETADKECKFFALLLNTTTKDEGEEFLDYSFPSESPEMKAILPMKGVFLASCGVMKAAVGQEVKFLGFRSIDGAKEFKVSLRPLERWILCLVLPASAADSSSQFFVEEAVALIGLRHGRLSSLQGNFRQLDPIFKALATLWHNTSPAMVRGSHPADAATMYTSLGQVTWHPRAEEWCEVVGLRISEWEKGWSDSASSPPLAQPQGFALFADGALVATSLSSASFTACLRLLSLEGMLSDATSASASSSAANGDVRCHSLFLENLGEGDALPSHQYSLLQRGPWLFFLLWNMTKAAATSKTPSSGPASKAGSGDPFGVDLSLDLLEALPMPPRAATPTAGASPGSGRSAGRTPSKKGFSLPCSGSIFKPAVRSKSSEQDAAVPEAQAAVQAADYLCAFHLQSQEGGKTTPETQSFSKLQEPSQACHTKMQVSSISCPVLGVQARKQKCSEWPVANSSAIVGAWSDLQRLSTAHDARRASWQTGPLAEAKRHVLLEVLRGDNSLDKLWDSCLEGSSLSKALESADPKEKKKTEATLLGSGEPWRFQAGAPYPLSDIPPLTSAGSLNVLSQSTSWVALSAVPTVNMSAPVAAPAGGKADAVPGSYALLAMAEQTRETKGSL